MVLPTRQGQGGSSSVCFRRLTTAMCEGCKVVMTWPCLSKHFFLHYHDYA